MTIDRLAIGGRGVGRQEGLVIFVPDSAPGEQVLVEITLAKKSFAEARIVEILQPSPSRIVPLCPVAGICGGCSWQHIAYDEQLRQKHSLVSEALHKFLKQTVNFNVNPVIPSSREFRYRNRVQLHFAPATASGLKTAPEMRLGFHRRASHDIVAIDDCPITEEILTREFANLRKRLHGQSAGRIELYISRENKAVCREPVPHTNQPAHESMHLQYLKSGRKQQSELTESPFSQVNTEQNLKLIAYVISILETSELGSDFALFDLYCGNGNFTHPIAERFPDAQVTGVEWNAESVSQAQDYARTQMPNSQLRFQQGDVSKFLLNNPLGDQKTNLVVLLDPPRIGCDPHVLHSLAAKKPSLIIYVSCHPVTLARDLSLLNLSEYDIQQIQPFDMFPQTDHVETVVTLRRKSSLKTLEFLRI